MTAARVLQSFLAQRPKNGDVVIAVTNDSTVWAMSLFMRVAGMEYRMLDGVPQPR